MPNEGKTALIVGATRGLGLGLVRNYIERGWRVVATSRGRNDDALDALAKTADGRLTIERLEVTDPAAIDAMREKLAATDLDLLFVSAGISDGSGDRIADASAESFSRVMLTNTLAPLRIIEALGSRVTPHGVIVAMTSVLGSVAQNTTGGYEVYRASKAALNTLLRSYAAANKQRSIVAMHPGWVRTEMGGANAAISVEESVAGMVKAIASRGGRTGCVFLDYKGETIAW